MKRRRGVGPVKKRCGLLRRSLKGGSVRTTPRLSFSSSQARGGGGSPPMAISSPCVVGRKRTEEDA